LTSRSKPMVQLNDPLCPGQLLSKPFFCRYRNLENIRVHRLK